VEFVIIVKGSSVEVVKHILKDKIPQAVINASEADLGGVRLWVEGPTTEQLNLWYAEDLGKQLPYSVGSLLYWRKFTQEDDQTSLEV